MSWVSSCVIPPLTGNTAPTGAITNVWAIDRLAIAAANVSGSSELAASALVAIATRES